VKVANECAVRGYLAGLSVVRKVDDSSRQCSVWAVGVRGPAVPALSCLLSLHVIGGHLIFSRRMWIGKLEC
jgi:hypothetical protein